MRNILLILFLFLLFSCKKEEKVEYYIKYEVQGKSRNNISLSPTGLQVIYTYFTDYKPVTKIESNDEKHEYIIGPVEKGFVATLKVKNNCKPLGCYIKPLLRIYAGNLIKGSLKDYYWEPMKEDSSVSIVDSLTISYIVK
jgi:hypothetical protein